MRSNDLNEEARCDIEEFFPCARECGFSKRMKARRCDRSNVDSLEYRSIFVRGDASMTINVDSNQESSCLHLARCSIRESLFASGIELSPYPDERFFLGAGLGAAELSSLRSYLT